MGGQLGQRETKKASLQGLCALYSISLCSQIPRRLEGFLSRLEETTTSSYPSRKPQSNKSHFFTFSSLSGSFPGCEQLSCGLRPPGHPPCPSSPQLPSPGQREVSQECSDPHPMVQEDSDPWSSRRGRHTQARLPTGPSKGTPLSHKDKWLGGINKKGTQWLAAPIPNRYWSPLLSENTIMSPL